MTRYKLVGAPARLTLASLSNSFMSYRARPFKLSQPHPLVYGWDMPDLGIDAKEFGNHWDLSHCQYDDGLILRIRTETRRVPKSLLAHVHYQRLEAMNHKQRPLNREEKQQLMDEIEGELLAQALPEIKYTDVLWPWARHEVFLMSTAKRDIEIFEKLFTQSFTKPLDCSLVKIAPPLLGMEQAMFQQESTAKPKGSSPIKGLLNTTPSQLFVAR